MKASIIILSSASFEVLSKFCVVSIKHSGISCFSYKQAGFTIFFLRITDQPVEAGELGAEEGDRELEEPAGGRREGQRHRTDPAARERSEF